MRNLRVGCHTGCVCACGSASLWLRSMSTIERLVPLGAWGPCGIHRFCLQKVPTYSEDIHDDKQKVFNLAMEWTATSTDSPPLSDILSAGNLPAVVHALIWIVHHRVNADVGDVEQRGGGAIAAFLTERVLSEWWTRFCLARRPHLCGPKHRHPEETY